MQEDASQWFGEELGPRRPQTGKPSSDAWHHLLRGMEQVFPQLQELRGGRGSPRGGAQVSRCHTATGVPLPSLCAEFRSLLLLLEPLASAGVMLAKLRCGEEWPFPALSAPGRLLECCMQSSPLAAQEGSPAAQGTGVCPSVGDQSCALNVTLCIVWRMVERRSVIELLQW